ncbi:MAG TPA: ABC transporter substrate-binding protein [Stellaceae bacterium]|jgi:NitT/TauT family transport system substrate-binding protein|nr:ABC transporter substrate-binding protein [Stellaceae bacterium]
MRVALVALFLLAVGPLAFVPGARAETVKIGIIKTTASGPIFVADAKGYFATEGITLDLVYFDSGQPISVAVASGDIDFGSVGFTGGFYSLASQGVLKIVTAGVSEVRGRHNQAFVASNKAWDAGLRSLKDLPGHSFALTQIGSPLHYALGLVAQKYGFDLGTLRLLPLQAIPATVAAVTSGQADATGLTGSLSTTILAKGDAKLLAYVGDEVPFQLSSVFASTKTADQRGDMVRHVLNALRKGARDYHDALNGAKPTPQTPEVLAILAKATGQTPEDAAKGLPYMDPDGRLNIADVLRQYRWYRAQGMVKGPDNTDFIDKRYVIDVAR